MAPPGDSDASSGLNAPGVGVFTSEHEAAHTKQVVENLQAEAWKKWPNEAAFTGLDEHRGPIPLHVEGHIPAWAAGALYRTGPGLSEIETNSGKTHYVSHWFDGFGHTHKFDIGPASEDSHKIGADSWLGAPATVMYSSRRQSDEVVESVRQKGWRASTSFGQRADPCIGIFAKAMSHFQPKLFNNNVVVELNAPGLPSVRGGGDTSKSPQPNGKESNGVVASGHRPRNVFITTDNAGLQEIDPATLEPIGCATQDGLHPDLRGPLSCAHAQRDPITGDLFNFNLDLGKSQTYRVFRTIAATGHTEVLATVVCGSSGKPKGVGTDGEEQIHEKGSDGPLRPAYIHSMFLSPSYVILCVPSSHYGWSGLKIPWERNILEAVEPWDSLRRCEWVVVDRLGGQGVLARFSTPAGFFFHSINAFEEAVTGEGGHEGVDLCLDLVEYPSTDIMMSFYYDVLLDRDGAMAKHWLTGDRSTTCQPSLTRYRYHIAQSPSSSAISNGNGVTHQTHPSSSTTAAAERVFAIPGPHVGDLPTINPLRSTLPHRYVYSVPSRGLSTLTDALAKTDVRTRATRLWRGPQGHSPGEPIFVPRPGASQSVTTAEDVAEDDGVILSLVLDGPKKASYLLCLDARTMEEVGRAEADFAIAMGFHGVHNPAV